jgi:hypothetical protein
MGRYRFAILILMLPGACAAQERGGMDPGLAVPWLVSALSFGHFSGSIEYWGSCNHNPDFPILNRPQQVGAPVVRTLREMFSEDPEMRVRKDADGMVRMVETDVPEDILNVVIGHLSFGDGDLDTFNPNMALQAILRLNEVTEFMKKQGIGPVAEGALYITGPLSGSPHLSGELRNVTVRQALDYLLQGFPGFWVYENCHTETGGRTVHFAFFQIPPPGVVTLP